MIYTFIGKISVPSSGIYTLIGKVSVPSSQIYFKTDNPRFRISLREIKPIHKILYSMPYTDGINSWYRGYTVLYRVTERSYCTNY